MRLMLYALCCCALLQPIAAADDLPVDLEQLEQQAIKAAVSRVAASVVQIRSIGGLDQVDGTSLAAGPATGVILTEDCYIVSSSFHFASRPTSIIVRLPDGTQLPAVRVGTDANRMLTLLKVAPNESLKPAEPAALGDLRVGQSAVAVGRTFRDDQTNVSVGIICALRRMHGRAVQTDAAVSAANYGGPLVDIEGRVIGILVPMAPQSGGAASSSEIAGAQFYDSGIGFAIPLEHVLTVLPRWIEQGDLKHGLVGIGLAKGNPYVTEPVVESVWPNSPAAEAGWQTKDRIVAVNGTKVSTLTHLRFQFASLYAGDVVDVRLSRNANENGVAKPQEIETQLTLAAELGVYRHPYLGVAPIRSASTNDQSDNPGVQVRAVWPDSPADAAGLKANDWIVAIDGESVGSVEEIVTLLQATHVDDQLELTVDRTGDERTLAATVGQRPDGIPDPQAGAESSVANPSADEFEIQSIKFPDFAQQAWSVEPSSQDRAGLLVWLADVDVATARQIANDWSDICQQDNLAIVVVAPADQRSWSRTDAMFAQRLLKHLIDSRDVDPRRAVAAGIGKSGQVAVGLAFQLDQLAGAATVDAPLPRTLSIPTNRPDRLLSVLAVQSSDSPMAVLIRQDVRRLREAGYPAALVDRKSDSITDDQRLDAGARELLARWINTLDAF